MIMECHTLYRFDTEYSADSCEFNPVFNVLATGTYQVNKLDPESESPETERLGRIYLHNIDIEQLNKSASNQNKISSDNLKNGDDFENELAGCTKTGEDHNTGCHKTCAIECPAVLDLKWNLKEGTVLAAANAKGQLVLYRYEDSNKTLKIGEEKDICDGLALAIEWNLACDKIILSDSKGKVRVVDPNSSLEVLHEYECHGYEAWTCCFSAWDDNIIFSGGDDCCFNCYDVRMPGTAAKKNSKAHSMGVTAMISDRCKENQIITGSYDEKLRWWDERNLRSEVSSLEVGGGVWRIKQRPQGRLLVGAMHGGFCVVEEGQVVASYDEHKSLAYGADWVNDSLAATSSFYDHLLTLWSFS
eukprot:TRINITY_DN1724_c0_g1_i10.p1 TRINITY_DN1724_c0_g1~~TRINITY_DN1724_c0_g1_i10.p1  ORF type:complete len:359 (+),score=50.18 TRINITY_DN1724_c0_g1_i10:41-1117(+)